MLALVPDASFNRIFAIATHILKLKKYRGYSHDPVCQDKTQICEELSHGIVVKAYWIRNPEKNR